MDSVPRSALEQLVARIAGDVLGVGRVGLHDDLSGTEHDVARRLSRELGVAAREPREARTVAGLAAWAAGTIRPGGRAEALAGVVLFADGMSETEREIRLRQAGCARG